MADDTLVGRNYITPDLVAKVTGQAKYAEDFRADGMLFCKLLLSPMPHARVRRIDTRAALAMEGVRAILTADDLPEAARGDIPALTNEPHFKGEPILAVAAVDEATAAAAIEQIELDLELLPFVTDPLESLRPGSPNATLAGNVLAPASGPARRDLEGAIQNQTELRSVKWTEQDFADAGDGQLPMGAPTEEWSFGDLEAGMRDAALVVDETFVVQATSHQTMETRSAMAYWRNGKVYVHGSTQSTMRTHAGVARWVGVEPSDVVFISEYTGGGFGSKGGGAVSMCIPALLAKKTNAPVMMRISREEEHYIGHARTNMTGRARVGLRADGRILALDLFIVQDNGARGERGDHRAAGMATSLLYQPLAMRWRAVNVLTNTPTRLFQRSPGEMQGIAIVEQALTKGAATLGIDQVEMRKINAPAGKALFGPARNGERGHATSAFVREALEQGAERFGWAARAARAGQRSGTKARGVGVAVGTHTAGSVGHDGLMTIRPDGRLHVQSGVGNLGTHSLFDLARVAADILAVPWEKVDIAWGDTSKHLPYSCLSVGSQTIHAMTRANHAAAMDARRKLQEIAARDLGGAPDDYDVGGERVFRTGNPGRGLTYAQAATRAIALGGRYDGHELPEDIHATTRAAAGALVGLGLMGVAKDTYPRDGTTYSFVAGFAEVEVDLETGKPTLIDYLSMADIGTVINPRSMVAQVNGGSCLGIGHALCQKWVYDPHYGVALATRFHHNKPLTILDIPSVLHADAVGIPDPETPVGARGVGEPPVGAAYGAVMNAIASAVGVDAFRRAPVTPDILLMTLEHGRRMHQPLQAHL
ncbi:MAG: xanthine dehydrogenase family protein molybdopterin-binding subunit [Vicinamibacterales bacterium]